jgi:hypothetical protein
MNMLETLGTLVAIGTFVFWCDVTDSWKNVFLRNKLASWLRRALDPVRTGLSGLKRGKPLNSRYLEQG